MLSRDTLDFYFIFANPLQCTIWYPTLQINLHNAPTPTDNFTNTSFTHCLRFFLSCTYTRTIAIKLNSLLFSKLYEYHIRLFIFNVYHKLFNPGITCLFLLANNLHSHNTRSVDNSFFLPCVNSSLLQKQLPHAGYVMWSALPAKIKTVNVKLTFKNNLKQHLMSL